MRFEVPQFIDVEDKIFGQLTFKQFIYLIGGGGLGYVSFKLLPIPFSFLLGAFFIIFGLMLAFYKVNNRPFIEVAQNWLIYKMKGKLYIWKRSPPSIPKPIATPVAQPSTDTTKEFTKKTIDELAQNLDILDQ